MIIKVSSNSRKPLHLWAYENFKEHYNAVTIDFDMQDGVIINHIIYEIQGDTIDLAYADEHGFKVEVLK